MNITVTKEADSTTLRFDGRLDTSTSPKLEEELVNVLKDAKEVIFDFEKLE